MKKGLFITFEGPDGSGKTTQIKLLSDYLEKKGFDVLLTVEPGGTEVGRKIRDILLTAEKVDISAWAETFLFLASRAELVSKVIKPALSEGRVVICDRFFDSTVVYQGVARGLGEKKILDMSLLATGGLVPDITFLLLVDVKRGKKRIDSAKRGTDRIEMEEDDFKEKIYSGYLKIARGNKDRFVVIDGGKSIENIFEEIKNRVYKYLKDLK